MLEPLVGVRVVATASSLDALAADQGNGFLRIAPDEAFILDVDDVEVADPHAIVESDSGWAGLWMPTPQLMSFLSSAASWEPPYERPVFAQGMVAGIATKILINDEQSLLVVPRAFAAEMTERFPPEWAR